MSAVVAALWILNLALNCAGQLAFKMAARNADATEDTMHSVYWRRMARAPWLWLGLLCFVVEFVAWIAFLSLIPLSAAVLLGSLNIVVLMLAGRWLFRERLTAMHLVGMLLVSAGVAITGVGG